MKLTTVTFQEKPLIISELQGRTDEQGKFSFQFVLPDFFTGMPQKHEQAFLDLTAEVDDTAQHAEQTTLSLSVAHFIGYRALLAERPASFGKQITEE